MTDEARVPTGLRPLLVLEALSKASGPLTPAELGRIIDLPKPTVHRLCATLLAQGFVTREPGARGLRPARRARMMASGLLHANTDTITRRQILNWIAETVRETVNFAAPTEDGMTYVDRVETDWAFRIQLPIGAVVPFHRTASGKTFLASLPPRRRGGMVATLDFSEGTTNAHKSPESLLAELERIADQGYALDNEELMEDMVALSVPVLDPDGRFMAAVAFHGPYPRLTTELALEHLPTLREASRRLSALLT